MQCSSLGFLRAGWLVLGLAAVGCTVFGGGGGDDGEENMGGAMVSGCDPGTESCACYPNGTCNSGLTCASQLCVSLGGSTNPMGGGMGTGTSGTSPGGDPPQTGPGGLVTPPPTDPAPTGDCASGGRATVTGSLRTDVANVTFNAVTVEVRHKRDVDVAEDGCLRELVFHLKYGDGCALDIVASDEIDLQGRMKIKTATFSADSQCPMFPDDREGMYGGVQAFAFGGVSMQFDNVGDYNVAEACIQNTFYLQPIGEMRDGSGRLLMIASGTDLAVSGTFTSTAADGACPVRAVPPPPPPPPPVGGSGGSGSGTGGQVGVPTASCPAPHMCVVNTTAASVIAPHACSLSAGGFPITCTSTQQCIDAGFSSSAVLCIGKLFAFPDDYCFQPCEP